MATPQDQQPSIPTTNFHPLTDPWTPPQESSLLKALILYPPKGLHAHFRMLSIRQSLLQSGTIDPEAPHTRIPGIWEKLRHLYDLDALNEREDAGVIDREEGRYWRDFELGDGGVEDDDEKGGFEGRMWVARFAVGGSEGDSSGDEEGQDGDGGGEVGEEEDEVMGDDLRSSPVTTGRGMRSGKRGRVGQLKDEMEVDNSPASSGRGSSRRRLSKAVSVSEVGDGDHVMEDGDDSDDDGETDEGSSDEVEDEDEKRGSGTKRGRGARRGGGGRGRRGRKRG